MYSTTRTTLTTAYRSLARYLRTHGDSFVCDHIRELIATAEDAISLDLPVHFDFLREMTSAAHRLLRIGGIE